MNPLVVGLGNPLLADDAVGLRVVERLREGLGGDCAVDTDLCTRGGLFLMERMIDRESVIVVDAIVSGAVPGTVHRLDVRGLPTLHGGCSHDLDLASAIELGRLLGARLPSDERIVVVAVEAAEVRRLGDACTPAVARAIPRAIEVVRDAVSSSLPTVPRLLCFPSR